MKNVLKTKTVSILLILVSVNFICPGCCRKKGNDGGNNGEGSRKASKPTVTKPMFGVIKTAIENYINTKTCNRTSLETTWEVGNCPDGSYIITFELFKVTIAEGEIEKLTSPVNTTQIDNIEVVIQMTRKDKVTNFIFNNGGKCKLGDLMKSLNVLDENLRNNNTDEYLRVKDLNGKFKCSCYLNLKNGLIYKITSSKMIGRASKELNDNNAFINVEYPVFLKGEYYDEDDKWNKKDVDPKLEYVKEIFESGDIKNFKFKLKTE